MTYLVATPNCLLHLSCWRCMRNVGCVVMVSKPGEAWPPATWHAVRQYMGWNGDHAMSAEHILAFVRRHAAALGFGAPVVDSEFYRSPSFLSGDWSALPYTTSSRDDQLTSWIRRPAADWLGSLFPDTTNTTTYNDTITMNGKTYPVSGVISHAATIPAMTAEERERWRAEAALRGNDVIFFDEFPVSQDPRVRLQGVVV